LACPGIKTIFMEPPYLFEVDAGWVAVGCVVVGCVVDGLVGGGVVDDTGVVIGDVVVGDVEVVGVVCEQPARTRIPMRDRITAMKKNLFMVSSPKIFNIGNDYIGDDRYFYIIQLSGCQALIAKSYRNSQQKQIMTIRMESDCATII
jgi:hypothetical protein